MISIDPEESEIPVEALYIHADSDECPVALAEIEYAEGVSNYKVPAE